MSDELAAAMDRIAVALERRATIEEKRFDRLYPPERPRREAEIYRPGDEKREQFSDRPTEQWITETESATPQAKSRFQERFEDTKAGDKGGDDAAGSSPKKDRSPSRTAGAIPKNK